MVHDCGTEFANVRRVNPKSTMLPHSTTVWQHVFADQNICAEGVGESVSLLFSSSSGKYAGKVNPRAKIHFNTSQKHAYAPQSSHTILNFAFYDITECRGTGQYGLGDRRSSTIIRAQTQKKFPLERRFSRTLRRK